MPTTTKTTTPREVPGSGVAYDPGFDKWVAEGEPLWKKANKEAKDAKTKGESLARKSFATFELDTIDFLAGDWNQNGRSHARDLWQRIADYWANENHRTKSQINRIRANVNHVLDGNDDHASLVVFEDVERGDGTTYNAEATRKAILEIADNANALRKHFAPTKSETEQAADAGSNLQKAVRVWFALHVTQADDELGARARFAGAVEEIADEILGGLQRQAEREAMMAADLAAMAADRELAESGDSDPEIADPPGSHGDDDEPQLPDVVELMALATEDDE